MSPAAAGDWQLTAVLRNFLPGQFTFEQTLLFTFLQFDRNDPVADFRDFCRLFIQSWICIGHRSGFGYQVQCKLHNVQSS